MMMPKRDANGDYPQPAYAVEGQVVLGPDVESSNGSARPQGDDADSPLLPLATSSADTRHDTTALPAAAMDKGWAVAFKINVFVTLLSAAWFGTMAFEALASDALSGAGRRRLQLRQGSEDSSGEFSVHHLSGF